MPLNQQAKKGVVLIGVTNPGYEREVALAPHNGGKEEHVRNTGDPTESLSVLPCVEITGDGKLQQLVLPGLLMAQTTQE